MIDIYKIMETYAPDTDIFTDEEEITQRLKDIIWNDLDEVDRRVILMYAHLASLRKLAAEIGVSPTAASQKIKQIKKKIYDKLDNN